MIRRADRSLRLSACFSSVIQRNTSLTIHGSIDSIRQISLRRKRAYLIYLQKLKKAGSPTATAEPPPPLESPIGLVFGRPMPDLNKGKPKKPWPRDFSTWSKLLSATWKEYVDTFEGFLWLDEKKREAELEAKQEQIEKIKGMLPKKEEVQRNLKRNYVFMRFEGKKLINQAKEVTGIHTRKDLQEFVISMLKLVNDCINEFMAGYRKGRDDEMQLMMTRDFGQLFQAAMGDEPATSMATDKQESLPIKPKRRRIQSRKRF